MKCIVICFCILFLFGCQDDPKSLARRDSIYLALKNELENNQNKVADSVSTSSTLSILKDIAIDSSSFKALHSSCTIKKDEFSESKFIQDKTSPIYVNRNGIYCTVTESNLPPALFFHIQYYAENWLFIKTMTFNIDGENVTYTPSERFKTDNEGGKIWEWSNEQVLDADLPLIVKLALGGKAKVKYEGSQYYKIVAVKPVQQAAIKKMLQIYKGLLLGY